MPLIQGGLEITIKVKIIWYQEEKLLKFKSYDDEVKHSMTGEHNDDSKSTLSEIWVHKDEDDNADDDVANEDDEELLEVEENIVVRMKI